MKIILSKILVFVMIMTIWGCMGQQAELGSKKNPIKMYFVPSVEAGKIVVSGKEVADYLSETTGYHFRIAVPTSYASVVEALGTNETDIAWLATFAYILANEKFDAQVALTTVRNGLDKYRGQFVVQADSPIHSLEDLEGKVIAYTDAASTSGYIYPSAILAKKGIKVRSIFAGGHPQAILAVLQGRADVGCTYWSPPDEEGIIKDARDKLFETYPDIEKITRIIGFTDWIPNDTVTFRKDFPPKMKQEIVTALLAFAQTEEGHQTLVDLFNIDSFVESTNADYDVVREALRSLGTDAAAVLK